MKLMMYFRRSFCCISASALFFQTEEQKRAWLIRATVNKCRQYNFGKWNLHVDRTAEPEISAEFESQADKELYVAVKELPPKLREAVYLHWFIGMNVGETADILGVRANTVSMRLAKAKKLLQKRLEEEI
nr:sigma factor-like helix-turn-helix DNA-binding protein [Ruminococcus sp.]